jgi:hypothetical protein
VPQTGLNVAVGSTGSASFAIGTAITLRATNERDANGNATVTANVQ